MLTSAGMPLAITVMLIARTASDPPRSAAQQALTAIGDYTDDNGTKMSEYLTFVQSDKTKMFFSVTSAAADFPDVMARF